jgi:hypothetical protein
MAKRDYNCHSGLDPESRAKNNSALSEHFIEWILKQVQDDKTGVDNTKVYE